MLRSAFPRHQPTFLRVAHSQPRRNYAEAVNVSLTTSNPAPVPGPGSVPPRKHIAVNPNHGLYAFFRKKVGDDEKITYETLTGATEQESHSGRSWKASELRLKSFKDLHTLWYVLLREKNLLATQREEQRRVTGTPTFRPNKMVYQVRKSMARIKYVINERRLAYEGAVTLLETQRAQAKEDKQDQHVLKYQMDVWNKERMQRGRKIANIRRVGGRSVLRQQRRAAVEKAQELTADVAAAAQEAVEETQLASKVEEVNTEKVEEKSDAGKKAEERAAAGLFGSGRN